MSVFKKQLLQPRKITIYLKITKIVVCLLTVTALTACKINVTNEGGGVVSSNDGLIDCGDTCSAEYSGKSTPVVLTAVPDDGFEFAGFVGPCDNTPEVNGNTCEVNIGQYTANKNILAKFIVADENWLLIEESRAHWEASNLPNYVFTYYASPTDCPFVDPIPPAEITVEDSTVVSVFMPELGIHMDVDGFPTIDDVFSSMKDAISSNPMIFSRSPDKPDELPLFDSLYGFPVAFFKDQSVSECDGMAYSITEFHEND